jgi:hypothetical protein
MTIDQHIQNNEEELKDPMIGPQRRRHLYFELEDLLSYKELHPNEEKDPNPLELFCGLNPDAPECKIFNL